MPCSVLTDDSVEDRMQLRKRDGKIFLNLTVAHPADLKIVFPYHPVSTNSSQRQSVPQMVRLTPGTHIHGDIG